jgi:hypothetical protein
MEEGRKGGPTFYSCNQPTYKEGQSLEEGKRESRGAGSERVFVPQCEFFYHKLFLYHNVSAAYSHQTTHPHTRTIVFVLQKNIVPQCVSSHTATRPLALSIIYYDRPKLRAPTAQDLTLESPASTQNGIN